MIARVIALIVAVAGVLGVAWYISQSDPDGAFWILLLGCLFFIGPAFWAVIDRD